MPVYRKCSICHRKVKVGTKCKCELQQQKERYKEYNKYVRWNKDNIKYSKFYGSVEWKRSSNYIRIKYNNMCLVCLLEDNKINVCDVVHHVIPIRIDFSKRLQEDNLITLCHSCHNKIDHENITEKYIKQMELLKNRYEEEF